MTQTEKNRKMFAIGLSAIATAVTLASAAATYSMNVQSFSDWGETPAKVLAILATTGIELTFALFLYGLMNAVTGSVEKGIAIFTLISLLAIMATNYTIHRQMVTGTALSGWQTAYVEWIGSVLLFGIVAIIIVYKAVNYESKERRMARDIEYLGRQRALEWKMDQLNSPELSDYLAQYQPAVFDEVKRTLALPARTYSTGTATASGADPTGRSIPQRPIGRRPGFTAPDVEGSIDNYVVDAETGESPKA